MLFQQGPLFHAVFLDSYVAYDSSVLQVWVCLN